MDLSGTYKSQPVSRIGATYQGELLRPILTEVNRELLRRSSGNGPGAATTSHHRLSDLTYYDDHPQYLYLAGRTGGQTILSTAAADNVLTIRGTTSQSGDLIRIQDVSSNSMARVDSTGTLILRNFSSTHTMLNIVGSTGSTVLAVSDNFSGGAALTIVNPIASGTNVGTYIQMSGATGSNAAARFDHNPGASADTQGGLLVANGGTTGAIVSWWGRFASFYSGTATPAGTGYSFAQYYSASSKGVQFLGAVGNQQLDLSSIGAGNTVLWVLPATNAAGSLTNNGSGTLSWVAPASAAHVMLDSSIHTDTLTGTVVRGDLVIGNATPKWARVARGTAGQVLTSDGTDVAWQTPAGGVSAHALLGSAVHTDTVTNTVSRGSLIYGNTTPAWDELTIGAAATILRSDGTDAAWASLATAGIQPLDADLTAIAALATTAFGRSFLPLADAAAGRTLLGLGTLATQSGTFSGTSSGTNTGDQTITLTGDVTGSGTSSFAATIATAAVTLAKMANMATASWIGRNTAGTGVPEVLSVANVKTMLSLSGTNSGDQTITLTGDVTGTGTGFVPATIPNDTVTYAKMQNISATDRLLGRSTAGAGNTEEIVCTAFARTILDDVDAAAVRTTIGVGTGAGTVTSVALSLPADLTVSGSPVTTSGTLTAVWASQSANRVLAAPSGGAGAPTFRLLVAADLPTVPVAGGGTGLTSGTSGGILGFTGATTLASSVALTASALVLGGGAGATPTPMGSLGTTTTVLHGNAAGAPTFAAVSLTADVSGILPVANGGTGQTTALAAFNALSPLTTLGDLLTNDGTNDIRLAHPGAANRVLRTTSTAATWAQGDIDIGAGNLVTTGTIYAAFAELYSTADYSPQMRSTSVGGAGSSYFNLQRANAGPANVGAFNQLGVFNFSGYKDGGYRVAAQIAGFSDGTLGASFVSGFLAFRVTDAAGALRDAMFLRNNLRVGMGTIDPQGQLHVISFDTTVPSVIVTAVTSQTADLQQWQNSAGTKITWIDSSGNIHAPGGVFSSTIEAAGVDVAGGALSTDSGGVLGGDFISTGMHVFNGSAFTVNSAITELWALTAINYSGTALGNVSGIPIVGNANDPPAAGRMGKVDRTSQTASIAAVNLTNASGAGLYRVHLYVACTTASGSGAPTLTVNIAWTDSVGATNRNVTAEPGATAFPLPLSVTGRSQASVLCQVASGNITFSTTINSASGAPEYQVRARCEFLG